MGGGARAGGIFYWRGGSCRCHRSITVDVGAIVGDEDQVELGRRSDRLYRQGTKRHWPAPVLDRRPGREARGGGRAQHHGQVLFNLVTDDHY
jgi:hypothetical protein